MISFKTNLVLFCTRNPSKMLGNEAKKSDKNQTRIRQVMPGPATGVIAGETSIEQTQNSHKTSVRQTQSKNRRKAVTKQA